MKNYLKNILRVGISKTSLFEESKCIEFSNQISLFFAFISFSYVALFIGIKEWVLASIIFVTGLNYCGLIYLNSMGKFNLARAGIVTNTTIAIYLSVSLTGESIHAHFFLTFLMPLSLMLFYKRETCLMWYGLALPSLTFIVLELSQYQFFYKIILSDSIERLLAISVFVVTSVILIFIFQFYLSLFQHLRNNLDHILSIYPLTERELDIISELVKGKNNKDIASQLFIEESTVKNHLKSIFKKLDVKSRSELMAKCLPFRTL